MIPKGASVRIKVKEDSRDYITKGRTERIEIDGKSFNVVGKEAVKYNFGSKLYVETNPGGRRARHDGCRCRNPASRSADGRARALSVDLPPRLGRVQIPLRG